MAVKPLNAERVATYRKHVEHAMSNATAEQVAEGARWYADAREVACTVAARLGCSVEAGAGIIAALSPRKPWARNITEALDYAEGREVKTMAQQLEACDRVLAADRAGMDPLEHVTVPGSVALKTESFARNIAGDPDAVTVDVWMVRAAGITDRDQPTVVQYREITEAVRRIAHDRGLTPAAVQAIAWIGARGSAE